MDILNISLVIANLRNIQANYFWSLNNKYRCSQIVMSRANFAFVLRCRMGRQENVVFMIS